MKGKTSYHKENFGETPMEKIGRNRKGKETKLLFKNLDINSHSTGDRGGGYVSPGVAHALINNITMIFPYPSHNHHGGGGK